MVPCQVPHHHLKHQPKMSQKYPGKKSPFGVTDDNESIIYGSSPVPKLVSTTKIGKVNL